MRLVSRLVAIGKCKGARALDTGGGSAAGCFRLKISKVIDLKTNKNTLFH